MTERILVIDDDEGILESLRFLLEDAGYEVTTSYDGKACYQDFQGHEPSVILLDYWLPQENGGEITKKLKSRSETKHIPIIIVSASYNIKELVEKTGADDFISKPYDMYVLLSKIEKHMSRPPKHN